MTTSLEFCNLNRRYLNQLGARMSFYHSLIDLIKGLDKGRVRFVRSRLPHKQLRLFDFLSAQKKITSKEKIQAEIGTTAFGLDALLADLEKSIVTLVGEHALRKRPNAQIQQLIRLGHGYLELGKTEKAIMAFETARSLSYSIGDHDLAIQIGHLIKLYLPHGQALEAKEVALEISTLLEATHLQSLATQLRLIKRLPFAERIAKINSIIEALPHLPTDHSSRVLYYTIQVTCHALMERYDESVLICEKHLEVVQADINLLYNPTILSSSASACIIASFSAVETGKINQGISILDRFCFWLSSLELVIPDRVEVQRIYLQIMLGKNDQTLESVHSKAQKVDSELKKRQNDTSQHPFRLTYEIAVQFIQLKESGKWIRKLLKGKVGQHGLLWAINASILQLIPLIAREDHEELTLAIRRTSYSVLKLKKGSLTMRVLQKMVNTILRDPENLDKALKSFLEEYKGMAVEIKDLKLVAIEEMVSWAESKIRSR
jgi:tetratricopeptide (TPR) repeat protein